jgi:uncharacterized protein
VESTGECPERTPGSAGQPQEADAQARREGARLTALGKCVLSTDAAKARGYLEQACTLRDAAGCVELAALLLVGVEGTIHRDEPQGFEAAQQGCDLGSPQGCDLLAGLYQQGSRKTGVFPQNDARAFELFRVACRRGYASACASLSHCYAEGLGVAKDGALSQRYRWMAEELGYEGE